MPYTIALGKPYIYHFIALVCRSKVGQRVVVKLVGSFLYILCERSRDFPIKKPLHGLGAYSEVCNVTIMYDNEKLGNAIKMHINHTFVFASSPLPTSTSGSLILYQTGRSNAVASHAPTRETKKRLNIACLIYMMLE
jgi:hypothetical protein